jgi:CRISPR system Cascade subunit CasB
MSKESDQLIYGQMKSRLQRLDADTPHIKAMLAKLRRGVGKKPSETPEIFEITVGGLPEALAGTGENASPAENALHTALTLYALHRQGAGGTRHIDSKDKSIGYAARRLVRADGGNEDAIRRRFDTILTASDPAELAHHARGLVQLMRASDSPIYLNWAQFAVDLFRFQSETRRDDVRLKWGREFYRDTQPTDTGKGANQEEETQDEQTVH